MYFHFKCAFSLSCDAYNGGKKKRISKTGHICSLESLLIPKQTHNILDGKHVRMLDNEDKLRNYPQGKLPYNFTIDTLRKL